MPMIGKIISRYSHPIEVKTQRASGKERDPRVHAQAAPGDRDRPLASLFTDESMKIIDYR